MKLGASYFGNRILRHVKEDMGKMVRDGCNFVVHTMSEHDVAYHSRNMVDIVTVSRELGLEVFLDPWGVGRVFGGESFSTFVKQFPDSRQRLSFTEGDIKVNKACLNAKPFRDAMLKWIELAAHTGAEGVFWDEPHLYYGELSDLFGKKKIVWGCTCRTCEALFRDCYGYEMPREFTEEVKAFRQNTIVDFIGFLSEASAKQGLRNSICVLPMPEPKYGLYQWEKIAQIENIDIFGSDPYWFCYEKEVEDFVGRISQEVVRLCERYQKEPQIWIQAFRVPQGRESEVSTAIGTAFDSGVKNMATWCFDAGACMSYISSDRPEIVWDTVSKKYQALQTGSA
ncbi:MAG: hypothetical protein D8M57_07575 [Candidatus Scalindua sp. AMX11]|nr:MAG: hypothetical protein DWQ00_05825 [Candidatus Scalindua sp.]NOG82517.1 hypothetical protein [Planctomycetota bacterium]RZV93947.1 MAG: hypothetical protein EX341_03585 [Candidatus Scalindua sp. SCAELEC01]TDE65567.1 MAG: hypothetical protein D8M57_07575 [Candidatus Scalindua sp. AMX11]GJQ58152.1 MAG: hypothetical protein SCALA701_09530 [Candidatus Scalindua sp.]